MKTKRSRETKELAAEAYEAILANSKDKGLVLSKLRDKLVCNFCNIDCYNLIKVYAGTRIEDICWEVLDVFYNKKLNRILVEEK